MRFILYFYALFLLLTSYSTAQNLQLDPTFDHDGFAITDFGQGPDEAVSIALLPNGKYLLGGTAWNANADFAIARYHADGSPDLSFGSRGRAFVDLTGNDELKSIHVLPDGKILLAGSMNTYDEYDVLNAFSAALVRCHPDGSVDSSFGEYGRALTFEINEYYEPNIAKAAAVQPDGKILLISNYGHFGPRRLFRFTEAGQPDSTFGTNGVIALNVGNGKSEARAIAFQDGGKIIVAGTISTLNGDIWLTRLLPNGKTDTTFGDNGVTMFNLYPPNDDYPYHSGDYASAAVVQSDSAIVVTGYAIRGYDVQHLIAVRFTANGAPDRILKTKPGIISTPDLLPALEEGTAITLQEDGKIVVAGNYYDLNSNDLWEPSFGLLRYTTAGLLDSSFGSEGLKIINPGKFDRVYAVAALPGEKILVAGQTRDAYHQYYDFNVESNTVAMRLLNDGSPDQAFGSNGMTLSYVGTNTDRATDLRILADGNLLVGAVIDSVFPYVVPQKHGQNPQPDGNIPEYSLLNLPTFTVARYLSNGNLDAGFGNNGRIGFPLQDPRVVTPFDDHYAILQTSPDLIKTTIATRPNGNILVAGAREDNFGIAEFFPDGTQDSSMIITSPGAPIPIPPYVREISFGGSTDIPMAIATYGNEGYAVAGFSYSNFPYNTKPAIAWCCFQHIGGNLNLFTTPMGARGFATSVGFQHDTTLNRTYIISAGYYHENHYDYLARFFLMRLETGTSLSTQLDTTFGEAGFIKGGPDANTRIYALHIQPDNTILAAGAANDQMAVFRFLPDGAFDGSFGNDGVVIVAAGLSAQDITVQPNGRIVATGYSADKIVTARLLPNGQPDPTFGINGVLVTNLRGKKDRGNAAAIQADGKIVVAGASDDPYSGADIAVLRYKPDSGIPPLSAGATVVGVSCPGDSDGQATVTATGGFPPYTYKWNTGQTTSSLAGLSAAAYTVTVTDSVQVKFVLTVDVPIMPDTMAPSIFCPANMMTQACATAVQYDLPIATDNCGADAPELISGLPPGSVFPEGVTVVVYQTADAAGNTAACQFEIQVENTLLLTTDADPACPGELNLLTASAAGGTPPYAYTWSSGNNGPLVLTAISGLFTVTLTDALGCARSDTVSVQSLPPMDIAGTITPAWIDSANGAITVTVGGGVPPFTYAWYQAGQQLGTGPALGNIPGGDYTLIVTDAAGCMNTTLWTVPEVVATAEPANVLQCRVFPNPFTEKLTLQLELRHSAEVRWRICDLTGRCYDEHSAGYTGYLQTELQTGDLPAGMYLLYIRIGGDTEQRKVVKVGKR